MRQWQTLFQKEMLENWRNRKWIWVPLVMMLLTIMDPLSYYFLPEIIDLTGGVPAGTVLEVPTIETDEAIMMSIQSLSTFGMLVIALFTMGTIAGERKSGIAEMILVKPIRLANYVTAKWAAQTLLTWVSLFLGLVLSWYYINLLFGDMSFGLLLLILFFYGLWFTFIMCVSIFYNTLFHSPGVVAAATVGTIAIMGGVNAAVGHRLTLFPNQLSNHLQVMIQTGEISMDLKWTSFLLIILIVILLIGAIAIFKRKEIVHE